MDILDFIGKWTKSGGAEKANSQPFLIDLCDALGVPRPGTSQADIDAGDYVFEASAETVHEGGKITVRKMDLFKRGAFILESKQGSDEGGSKLGTAKRGTPAWHAAMASARGQAIGYARTLDEPPPFIITCDVGYCFDIHACFDGAADYRAFPNAAKLRIFVADLEGNADLLKTIWTNPQSLDPAEYSAKITREIAGHIADLARTLEEQGHANERVAKFLMRCLFTMFAEDVRLLPDRTFVTTIEKQWLSDPSKFKPQVESLWRIMNEGGDAFTLGKILRFNGGLFKEPEALALTKNQLKTLHAAARCTWEDVEPAIFGTLLERALDPKERHALGAHYTPRAYVERLVKPTIEEPLRDDWNVVQAQVHQLVVQDKIGEAQKVVRAFHENLCHIRVLDPACGTGNFLYVTLDVFKRLESEVNELLHGLGSQESLQTTRLSVTPEQFLGIEVKPWAREIAELVLWIGYLQWEFRTRGKTSVPEEPILRDYGNIEGRDAVLDWDAIEPELDSKGQPVTRWDGETMKQHPATGEDVPDDSARVAVVRYVNPRRTEWPQADFVVGNPPYIGTKRMRASLGDGYVDALREAYADDVNDSADLVMYWWHNAAQLIAKGAIRRFGFITTNSITQNFNRRVIARALKDGVGISWAIPDHPWIDTATGAAVRVAMTCAERDATSSTLLEVASELPTQDGSGTAAVVFAVHRVVALGPDLRPGLSLAQAVPLKANDAISGFGVALHGHGFVLEPDEAALIRTHGARDIVRPYLGGRDMLQVPRERYVIDFSGMTESEARAANPMAFQVVLDRVRPERLQNRRESIRRLWWRFGWERPKLRVALEHLSRFVVTTETAKHRTFQFVRGEVLPDHGTIVIATADALHLAILSSRVHTTWALGSGGTLEDRPRYNSTVCLLPFPFALPAGEQAIRIRDLGETLDAHRKRQLVAHPDLTVTAIYNVLQKLRSGEPLTAKEKIIHEHGLVATLQKIHDDVDAAVFDAYGWPHDVSDEQILENLVALNAERAEEERRGLIRWLRPDFQAPRETPVLQGAFGEEGDDDSEVPATSAKSKSRRKPAAAKTATADAGPQPWPATLAERIAAVRDLLVRSPRIWTSESVAAAFKRARRADVEAVLESLSALGLLLAYDLPDGRRYRRPSRPAA